MDDEYPNYEIIKLFFREKGLVRQHIDSYNYFIEEELKTIMEANNIVDSDIDHAFYLKYLDIRVGEPSITENMVETSLFPQECRTRDLTYAANIYVDIEYMRNKQVVVKRNLCMGKMPIMLRSSHCLLSAEKNELIESKETQRKRLVKSKECFVDNGGYFIIRGVERVILIQEQLSKNRIIVENGKNGMMASVTSSSVEHKSRTCVVMKNDTFNVQSTFFSEDMPAVIVIKAFGITSDQEIIEMIGKDYFDLLLPSFEEAIQISREEQARSYLSRFIRLRPDGDKMAEIITLLAEKIFPNIPIDSSLRNKGIYLCMMIRRLVLAHSGVLKVDDKDFLGNKRFELAGQLLSILFEDTFKRFNFELKRSIDKVLSKRTRTAELDALTFFNLQTNIVTTALSRAISSGNWNLKRFRMERSGVTSIVTRYSYLCALGMMTKINSHFEKTRKVSGPRGLHTSSWGMFCPADTPDGEGCGLVKNLALLAEITTDSDPKELYSILDEYGVRKIGICFSFEFHSNNNYLVFINGTIYGITSKPSKLAEAFRMKRRSGIINRYASICTNEEERSVLISTDNGRICRPLIVVDRKKVFDMPSNQNDRSFEDNFISPRDLSKEREILSKLGILFSAEDLRYRTFSDLLSSGMIEFLDTNEEKNSLIALKATDISRETTHLEISELAILGYVSSLVPFPHHNQSPRNTYQCAMGKQAIGHIATNVKKRFDSSILQLNYTQRPLVVSKIMDILKYNEIPSGFNAMVAVMSFTGYDIEDAIILNQASVDRGLARVEVYRTNTINLKRHHTGVSESIVPGGLISPGSRVGPGTVLLSKLIPTTNQVFQVKHREHEAHVEKVMLTRNDDETIVKIVTRETRKPEIGDKFSSRHGQKGVVGLLVPQVDMPFNEEGISPDLIMNPHGFPSRMTVGKILELVTGKAALLEGKIADASAFKRNDMADVCETLTSYGFNYSGKDVFTSGITGEPMEAYIFFGPVFYQRLKHMVADKMHCRARGPKSILTRQPTEGRSNDGGFRLGEMERDCIIGYGASELLNERLMLSSDPFDAHICKDCGIIVYKGGCTLCGSKSPVVVKMPYACKLLFQELISMNILPKIILEKKY